MIDICILDDKLENTEMLAQYAARFCESHAELSLRLQSFTSCAELLKHMNKYGGFDLYLLDVIMPDMTGVELAKLIRKRGEPAEIIFLTVSREYAVEAFEVKASGYLLKPFKFDAFNEAVLSCLKKLCVGEKQEILLETNDGIRRLRLRELVLVESFNHTRALSLSDGTVLKTSVTLYALLERLRGYKQFYMPHRAYIINMDYVTGIRKSGVLMTDNREIPVARSKLAELKTIFSDYFLKGTSV
ncbi:MAG: LytTR family DNA-binding domain-containing protein [Butyrivibrio sp.]|nr:LytTR family DNA-binding domain-containing protein [Butyrivibrio sp.]